MTLRTHLGGFLISHLISKSFHQMLHVGSWQPFCLKLVKDDFFPWSFERCQLRTPPEIRSNDVRIPINPTHFCRKIDAHYQTELNASWVCKWRKMQMFGLKMPLKAVIFMRWERRKHLPGDRNPFSNCRSRNAEEWRVRLGVVLTTV